MKKNLFAALLILCTLPAQAQMPSQPQGGTPAMSGMNNLDADRWEVNINAMDDDTRRRLTEATQTLYEGESSRSAISNVFKSMLTGATTSLVDVVATEVINLAKYRKKQKQAWMAMIQNECNYTDSISSIKSMKDFYAEKSRVGALDPSTINFDGITMKGFKDNREVIYLSCHIDRDRLEHMFSHSKFYLVLDTMAFHPYECHLPNITANGIRLMNGEKTERDNSFSYKERGNLNVGISMNISSSWINEAVMLMQNVTLGEFKMNVTIPDNTDLFTYSRRQILENRRNGLSRDTTLIDVEGDCFVVPRSFMPSADGRRSWGTGEYCVKIKFREACSFRQDDSNEKAKHWKTDYKQLRKMQKKGSEVGEYMRTVWNQNGETLIKTVVKQGFNQAVTEAGFTSSGSGGGMSGAAGGAMPSMGN